MGSSSLTQNRCRSRWCKPQITCGALVTRHPLSFWKDSVVFFRARFRIGVSPSQFFLHTGHVFGRLCIQLAFRHSWQKLWPHESSKGSRKRSWHTGQLRSVSRRDGLSVISSSIAQALLIRDTLAFTFTFSYITMNGDIYESFPHTNK